MNKQLYFVKRPDGVPTPDIFEIRQSAVPLITKEGELLIKQVYISLDPTQRMWMTDTSDFYMEKQPLNEVMRCLAIGVVEASLDPNIAVGSYVTSFGYNTQQYVVSSVAEPFTNLLKDESGLPITIFMNTLGPVVGLSAFYGTVKVLEVKAGETIVVSGAAGAVGSIVCQIAKQKGAKVIGIAGSDEKCAMLVCEFGCDYALNYKTEDLEARLRAVAPEGVDCYFDNTGGAPTAAVMPNFKVGGRGAVCGIIDGYNSATGAAVQHYEMFLHKRLRFQGFLCLDHIDLMPEMIGAFLPLVLEGKLKQKDDVTEGGLEDFFGALMKMLTGGNVGKTILKLV